MSRVNLEDMSREQLMDIIMSQNKQLGIYNTMLTDTKAKLKKSEDEYEILGDKLMQARSILNS